MTAPLDLDELEKLAKAATQGEWIAFFAFGSSDLPCEIAVENGTKEIEGITVPNRETICEVNESCVNPTPNFRYLSAANPATVLQLIARVKRLTKALESVCMCGSYPEADAGYVCPACQALEDE